MIPHVAPPVWPECRLGSFAAAVYRNNIDLFSTPHGAADVVGKCAIGLIGLADDTGVRLNNGRPGAARGPHAFRAALARYGVAMPELPSGGPDEAGAYPRVFDAGDVVLGESLGETHDRVTEAVDAMLELGLFPIAIGGGHDLTYPFVRAVHRRTALAGGVYIDPHLDVREGEGSGMPFRALIEREGLRSLRCHGFNPLVNTGEHLAWFMAHGGEVTARDAADDTDPLDATSTSGRLFYSFDMDVIDASQAPGVSALNPDGLSVRTATRLVEHAGRDPRVACFDIMELCPEHDDAGRTARVASHLFLSFLRGFARRAGSGPA